ncbi:hypothetical protein HYG81_24105 (plasmid) [Natrinema zhouii]|uniref:DUF7260 family protein n=1 Tax=Natrinema zhouii TaxID=1710539 RepID=UPI001CFF9B9F|nr:hypothetical protein [Natrinema zhouii]UHQ98856.1 hypothetical protein HYG81_24105 [Natrinema zhouii]
MTNTVSNGTVRKTEPGNCIRYLVVVLFLITVSPKLLSRLIVQTAGGLGGDQFITLLSMQGNPAALIGAAGYIRKAQSVVETERERMRTERDAFYDFAEEVRALSVSDGFSQSNQTLLMKGGTVGTRVKPVRDRYRETVMAVPHYDEDYGEPLRENMAAEFNRDIATVVVDDQPFSTQLKRLLVQQARTAARRREELLRSLSREQESLADASERLQDIEDSFDQNSTLEWHSFLQLVSSDKTLQRNIDACEQLVADRQRSLHSNRVGSDQLLQRYLYDHLGFSFPVLNAALDLIRGFVESL